MKAYEAQGYNEHRYVWNTLIASWFFKLAVYFYLREVYACVKFHSKHGKTSISTHGPSTNLYGDWAIPYLIRNGFNAYWETENGKRYLNVSWELKK